MDVKHSLKNPVVLLWNHPQRQMIPHSTDSKSGVNELTKGTQNLRIPH